MRALQIYKNIQTKTFFQHKIAKLSMYLDNNFKSIHKYISCGAMMCNRFIIQLTFVCVTTCVSDVVVGCCCYSSVRFDLSAAHWSSGGRQSKNISICANHNILFIFFGSITSLLLLLARSSMLYDGGVAYFIPFLP